MPRRRPAFPVPFVLVLVCLLLLPAAPLAAQQAAPSPVQQGQQILQPEGEGEGEGEEAAEEGGQGSGEEGEEPPPVKMELPEFTGDPRSAGAWRRYFLSSLASLLEELPDLLVALVKAVLVLAAFWLLYRLLIGLLGSVLRRSDADPSVLTIATRLTRWVLVTFAAIMAASQLGFQVGSLLAGLGIVGLAIGLAAQESLSNLVAGLTLLLDRPYRVGDNVTIADTFGQVQEIGLRTTRILTVERLDTILPNREIVNQKIVNHTSNPDLRLGVAVAIAYREDTREARRVLLAAAQEHDLIRDEPAPEVVVTRLADSGVELELRVWLRDPHREREALCVFTELAKVALDEAGIEIPFPQRTLHFGSGTFPLAVEERRPAGEEE